MDHDKTLTLARRRRLFKPGVSRPAAYAFDFAAAYAVFSSFASADAGDNSVFRGYRGADFP